MRPGGEQVGLAVGGGCRIRSRPIFLRSLRFDQRKRWASAILFHPSADMLSFSERPTGSETRGRPLRLAEAVPARRERADCKRAISASMAERMSCVFICVSYQGSILIASYVLCYIPSHVLAKTPKVLLKRHLQRQVEERVYVGYFRFGRVANL